MRRFCDRLSIDGCGFGLRGDDRLRLDFRGRTQRPGFLSDVDGLVDAGERLRLQKLSIVCDKGTGVRSPGRFAVEHDKIADAREGGLLVRRRRRCGLREDRLHRLEIAFDLGGRDLGRVAAEHRVVLRRGPVGHSCRPRLLEAVAGKGGQRFGPHPRLSRRQRAEPDQQDAGGRAADVFGHPDLEKISGL